MIIKENLSLQAIFIAKKYTSFPQEYVWNEILFVKI